MRLVARPKLKIKLETKAFKETAKLLRLTAGDKEAFTGRPGAHALPPLSCHCQMNLLISGAKGHKKKKKELDPKRKSYQIWPLAGAGQGGLAKPELLSLAAAAVRSPRSPSSPCPRDAHFYFSLWSNAWTYHDLY